MTEPDRPSLAPGWETWNGQYRAQFRPVTEWLCRAARLVSGMTVLDVATGMGQPAIAATERVRPGGRVVGIDSSQDMLAGCRRLARTAGVDNLELRTMDMHSLAFPEQTFDAVTFGFGLMFARDPVRVMTEVRRVMKPDARFALAVWDEPARNPLFATVFEALSVVLPDAKSPGPFRLAAHGELQSVLRGAGFRDFTMENVPIVFESASVDEHWQMLVETMPLVNAAVAGRPDDEVAKLKAGLVAVVKPYVEDGRVRLGATPLCATGAR